MIFLHQRFIFILILTISYLQAAPQPKTLQMSHYSQDKFFLNPTKNLFRFSYTSTKEDLLHRSLWALGIGAVFGITLGQIPLALLPMASDAGGQSAARTLIAGYTLPILCLTFIPGSTSYDHGKWGDWWVTTLGRGVTASLALSAGFTLGIISAALIVLPR